jgi:hypothetical protein
MPTLRKRLGASIFLTCSSLVSIFLLLPNSTVSNRLQEITIGYRIDEYGKLFPWGQEDEPEDEVEDKGLRLVVFGDNWVDNGDENGNQNGWTEALCKEVGFLVSSQ